MVPRVLGHLGTEYICVSIICRSAVMCYGEYVLHVLRKQFMSRVSHLFSAVKRHVKYLLTGIQKRFNVVLCYLYF